MLAIVALGPIVWWFQPQALFLDDVVDEGFPSAEPVTHDSAVEVMERDPGSVDVTPLPDGPVVLATGTFVSRNRYRVIGTATIHRLSDGRRILRLEDFESTNGPDLFVHLTVAGASDDDDALDAEFVDLGGLSGNIGDQNYAIPDEVDIDRYDTVVIWCRRFTTSFGVADLSS